MDNYEDMSEVKLTDLARLDDPHLFRNDCGQGWQGGQRFKAKSSGPVYLEAGEEIIRNPTRVKYGLQVGSGDLVGWQRVEVTPDLVGKTIAVFKSVEIKTKNDKIDREQIIWYFNVKLAGGIAQVKHCNKLLTVDEVLALPRRSNKAAEAKDKIIEGLHSEYLRRRGLS